MTSANELLGKSTNQKYLIDAIRQRDSQITKQSQELVSLKQRLTSVAEQNSQLKQQTEKMQDTVAELDKLKLQVNSALSLRPPACKSQETTYTPAWVAKLARR